LPIYEYLCPACNRVFSFLSRTSAPEHAPACPKCGGTDLRKRVSRFAFVRSGTGSGDEGGPAPGGDDPLDDPRVEREMMRLMQQAEGMDENDPRQLAQFMRRMSDLTGEPLDAEMEEAVRRLEAGEDVEKIEEEMGDLLGDGPDGGFGAPPTYDEGLYSM
jgi:putative FmdB family regulatory protein